MISINGKKVDIARYPDGTPRLYADCPDTEVEITWKYGGEEELFSLLALARSYKDRGCRLGLRLPYIPNARMDRVKNPEEVFTLKVFCGLINGAGFDWVEVLDAHSPVSLALLERARQMDISRVIRKAVLDKMPEDLVLYFPDEGSQKRYGDCFPEYPFAWGMKKRDWRTGRIQGLEIVNNGLDLRGKTLLMIDDIIAYGGSLYHSALGLKSLGAGEIFAYATHTENSVLHPEKSRLRRLLEEGEVRRLYTTDSLFTGEHPCIEVMEV